MPRFIFSSVYDSFGSWSSRNFSREGYQRFDCVSLLLDVTIKALLVAHRLQPGAGDNHRFGSTADLVARDGVEVLDHHLGLLRDVVRVQSQKASQRPRRFLPLDVWIVFAGLKQV